MNPSALTTRRLQRALGVTRRDVRLAAAVGVVEIGGTALIAAHAHYDRHQSCWLGSSCRPPAHLNAIAFLLVAIGPVALLARRRHPAEVLGVVFAATLTYVVVGYPSGPVFLSLAVAFATVVVGGRRLLGWLAVVAGWALFLWLPVATGRNSAPSLLGALALAAWLLVLLAGAEGLRGRRLRARDSRREREREGQRRADEERLRIARELHDVLAHNISLINVQSGVALHLLEEHPEQARGALSAINEASAEALREMRSVLGVLRRVDEQPPRAPTAGLIRLPDLVSSSLSAGVTVDVDVNGDQRPLPASVDLAAFRIVQESLTNVARHADASAAAVQLTYGERELTVQIEDDGHRTPAARSPNGGNGIPGMRERAAALGGDLQAGPRPGGGFRVRATLPLDDTP